MKTIPMILPGLLAGLVLLAGSNSQGLASISGSQGAEMISIEEILQGMRESMASYNESLENLTVEQTTELKSTLLGEVRIVSRVRFDRSDSIEQQVVEKEEQLHGGVSMEVDYSVTPDLFTQPPVPPLAIEDYEIILTGRDVVRGRPVYQLRVEPRGKQDGLVDGELWIDTEDFTVVRYEGESLIKVDSPDASDGTQILEYEKIDDRYWLPIRDQTETSWMIVIKLIRGVTYSNYEFETESNGR